MSEWNSADSDAAIKEGWNLYDSTGSVDGSPQVQRNDEQSLLDSDIDAWKLVANGNEQHHHKTLSILKRDNISEYNRIIKHKLS